MLIRKASKKDFEDYFKLEQEFMKFNNLFTKIKDFKYSLIKSKIKKDFLEKVNKRNKLFLVLEDNKKLQGYLYGTVELNKLTQRGYKFPINNVGYLSKVYISKKYRGKGNFSKMLNGFFKYLKSKDIKYCTLHSFINNKRALNIYKKLGFKSEQIKMVGKVK